jgi:hypothetical protein
MVTSRAKRGSVAVCSAALGALLLAPGCADLFGFERSGDVVECIHDSDCDDGLVCENDQCTPTCGDTTSSVDNCGSCGHVCTGDHVDWACVESTCVQNGCDPGWGDCNGESSDGCEVDVTSDGLNCSRCGDPCESTVCSASQCLAKTTAGPFAPPSSAASTQEIDTSMTDPGTSELFGIPIYIPQPSTLLSIAMVTSFGGKGYEGYLGLYQDLGGPTIKLVASTGNFTLLGDPTVDDDPQATESAVPHVKLQAGAYWIIGMWNQTVFIQLTAGEHGCVGNDPGCIRWYENTQKFASALPASLNALPEYPYGPTPTMYINIAQ